MSLSIKECLCEFIGQLHGVSNDLGLTTFDLNFISSFLHSQTDEDILHVILEKVVPHEHQIRQRDIDFFGTQKDVLFRGLPSHKITAFENGMRTRLSPAERECVWGYFDAIIELALQLQRIK